MYAPVDFKDDHFIYRVDRGSKGRDGKCSRCSVPFEPGELIRVPADLNDNGWWHESCITSSDSGRE